MRPWVQILASGICATSRLHELWVFHLHISILFSPYSYGCILSTTWIILRAVLIQRTYVYESMNLKKEYHKEIKGKRTIWPKSSGFIPVYVILGWLHACERAAQRAMPTTAFRVPASQPFTRHLSWILLSLLGALV
jgi:hypothetical protein